VLHTRPASPGATREPIQIGAEMFGDAAVGADVEIQGLLCDALAAAGMKGVRLGIGHVAVFRAIAQAAKISGDRESELFEALQKKDLPALKSLTKGSKARDALLLLPELYGDAKVLDVLWQDPLHDLAHSSRSRPTIIDDRPTKRICPSLIWVMRRNVSRQTLGARNGRTPSRMSIRASAMISVVPMLHRLGAAPLPSESRK
jgi:hypothetical protein